MGALVYCGLEGWMPPLGKLHSKVPIPYRDEIARNMKGGKETQVQLLSVWYEYLVSKILLYASCV